MTSVDYEAARLLGHCPLVILIDYLLTLHFSVEEMREFAVLPFGAEERTAPALEELSSRAAAVSCSKPKSLFLLQRTSTNPAFLPAAKQ